MSETTDLSSGVLLWQILCLDNFLPYLYCQYGVNSKNSGIRSVRYPIISDIMLSRFFLLDTTQNDVGKLLLVKLCL